MIDVQERSRSSLIFARWRSVLLCGGVAAMVVLLIEPLLLRLAGLVANIMGPIYPSAVLVAVIGLAICSCEPARTWLRGFLALRFLFVYPPLWVGVVFGFLVWFAERAWSSDWVSIAPSSPVASSLVARIQIVGWIAAAVLLLGVVWMFIGFRKRRSSEARYVATGDGARWSSTILQDFGALRDWLGTDKEVASPEEDLFDHDAIASRMAMRLIGSGEAPTMAVIGPRGSGKSTIRRLLECRLRSERRICMVSLSLWTFESSDAAVRGVLRELVRGLSRHVNVLPLVGLPDDYMLAIEKSSGIYGGIARLLRGVSDPTTVVQRFSDIARATGVRVVLWIEDLERFSGSDLTDGVALVEREVERLGPIRALLYLLDRAPHVSVIVSDVTLRTRFDLEKIVRFVEQVPPMSQADAWRAVHLVRTKCLGGYPVTVVDAASPKAREALILDSDPQTKLLRQWGFTSAKPSVPDAVTNVLKTPRMLKFALRVTLETWEAMPGEIDFDSVLVGSVLRAARPELFALISDHMDVFQHGATIRLSSLPEKSRSHPILGRIDSILEREDEWVAACLRRIIDYLLGGYSSSIDGRDVSYIEQPQALCVDRHVDYMRRYMALRPVAPLESDQRALESIAAWRAGEASDLIQRLLHPSFSQQIETFIGQFKAMELCRLLTQVADRLSGESASGWDKGLRAPGVMSVWRIMQRRRPREEEVLGAVLDIVSRLGAVHLPLTYDVVYFFATRDGNVPRLIPDSQQRTVDEAFVRVLTETYTGDGAEERLAFALRDGSPLVVWLIVSRLEQTDVGGGPGLLMQRWSAFAGVLLDLAERQPDLGIPIVVPFFTTDRVVDRMSRSDDGRWESAIDVVGSFSDEEARRRFDFRRLVRILANWEPGPRLDGPLRVLCEVAVARARQLEVS